jgi:hypothetical protein
VEHRTLEIHEPEEALCVALFLVGRETKPFGYFNVVPQNAFAYDMMRRPKQKAWSDAEPSSRPSVSDSRGVIVSFKKYRKTCMRNKVTIPH